MESGAYFSGTAVSEIVKKGIPSKKIVVGKPCAPGDAANTGYVSAADLGKWVGTAYQDMHWYAGIMYWQYVSDNDMQTIKTSAGFLKEQCAVNKNCK